MFWASHCCRLTNKRHSIEIICKHGEFSVNIHGIGKVVEVDYCGIVSGKQNDKFTETKLTPILSSKIAAPIISECAYNLECKVV